MSDRRKEALRSMHLYVSWDVLQNQERVYLQGGQGMSGICEIFGRKHDCFRPSKAKKVTGAQKRQNT